jgi:hypothetical protein
VEQTSVLPWFRDLVEVEQRATDIRTYAPYLIPGLFQTEAYTRAVAHAPRPALSESDIERAVMLRMTRQEILGQDEPPRIWAIIEESVLRRLVGGPEVMTAQGARLLALSRKPNITVQIISDSQGATCAFGRAFTILTAKPGSSVVYLEDIGSAHYLRDRDEVGKYVLAFDHLRVRALDDDTSADMIKGDD